MPKPTPQPPEANAAWKDRGAREIPLKDRIPPDQKKWIVMVLALIMFTHTMDFMVLMPLGPKLMKLFEITPRQFSFLVSIYSFTAGVCGFLGSLIFDRLDRKKALLGTYIGFLVGTIACAFAPNYLVLLGARALSGAFGGLLSGISFAIVGDLFSIQERGLATGKLMTSYSLAAIIGVPTGIFLANHFGWHATFGGIAIVGIFALILASKIIPNVRSHLQNHYSGIFVGLTENLKDPNSRTALATTFMMVLSQFVVIPFISPYLVANTGFPEVHLPLMYLIGGILTVISGIMMGRLCDHYGAHHVFNRTGLLFLVPVFFVTHLGNVGLALTLLTTTAIFVFSNFRSVPAITMISSSIPPSRRGSFMSLNSCIHQLGSSLATFVAGWFITLAPNGVELVGFSNTAYLSMAFGFAAYLFGQRIRMIA
ncbi:MAG: MFS transporter [Bdellovibrionales bacterium]|nr:MFS transporter [Oligoflexia bacterium]